MYWPLTKSRRVVMAVGILYLGTVGSGMIAHAQNAAPAPGGINAKRQGVEERQAEFKLIGSNFRSLGGVLKGDVKYEDAAVTKRIARLVFLTGLLNEAFSDKTNLGEPDTKAKPDIWTNRAEFDASLKKFQDDVGALSAVDAKEKGLTAPFKVALSTVAQDCKSCHEKFRVK